MVRFLSDNQGRPKCRMVSFDVEGEGPGLSGPRRVRITMTPEEAQRLMVFLASSVADIHEYEKADDERKTRITLTGVVVP